MDNHNIWRLGGAITQHIVDMVPFGWYFFPHVAVDFDDRLYMSARPHRYDLVGSRTTSSCKTRSQTDKNREGAEASSASL